MHLEHLLYFLVHTTIFFQLISGQDRDLSSVSQGNTRNPDYVYDQDIPPSQWNELNPETEGAMSFDKVKYDETEEWPEQEEISEDLGYPPEEPLGSGPWTDSGITSLPETDLDLLEGPPLDQLDDHDYRGSEVGPEQWPSSYGDQGPLPPPDTKGYPPYGYPPPSRDYPPPPPNHHLQHQGHHGHHHGHHRHHHGHHGHHHGLPPPAPASFEPSHGGHHISPHEYGSGYGVGPRPEGLYRGGLEDRHWDQHRYRY